MQMIIRKIMNEIECLGLFGGLKYRIFLEFRKKKIPLFTRKLVRFSSKKRGFHFYIRPMESDIFLIRELLLGKDGTGQGEYDWIGLNELFEGNEQLYIIDAGANIGLFSLIMASKYPNSHIIALEPDRRNYELLTLNTKEVANIQCLNAGLWNENCKLKLVNPGCASLSYRFIQSRDEGIDALSINAIMQQNSIDHIDILKMDIEGSEKDVFMKNTAWCRCVGLYFIEMHERYAPGCQAKIDPMLKGMGYKYARSGENHIYYKN